MTDDILSEVQRLQFRDLPRANLLLKGFLSARLPLRIDNVTVRPLAVSLNSINGILLTEDGSQFFFKAHIESSATETEYYNSELLERAGYPIIKPVFRTKGTLTESVLLYDVVRLPTMFEAMRAVDEGSQNSNPEVLHMVHEALDKQLWQIYAKTLRIVSAAEHATSPVHQLFYERLVGGRLTSFYSQATFVFPGLSLSFKDFCALKWVVNGVSYPDSLGVIIDRAIDSLQPTRLEGPAIIGHGDAHNGNLFLDEVRGSAIYFDPAFAGTHSPLLDLSKPIYHNTLGQWLYFPTQTARDLDLSVRRHGSTLYVDHNYTVAAHRVYAMQSKIRRVLGPVTALLADITHVPSHWLTVFRSALVCCPLLTMNLCDSTRFPNSITALGFSHVVQLGNLGSAPGCSIAESFADVLS